MLVVAPVQAHRRPVGGILVDDLDRARQARHGVADDAVGLARAEGGAPHELVLTVSPSHLLEVGRGERTVTLGRLQKKDAFGRAELPAGWSVAGIEKDLFDAHTAKDLADHTARRPGGGRGSQDHEQGEG